MANPLNVIVCGKFHYDKYVGELQKNNILEKVYFSHKKKSFPFVDEARKCNSPIKEYLLGAHLKFLKEIFLLKLLPLYHFFWQKEAISKFIPADINLFLLHGNCLSLIKKAKENNKIVIGEAVNLHPVNLNNVLEKESATLNSEFKVNRKIVDLHMQEIELCDFILAPSSAVAQSYIENGIDKSKVIVLPYGSNMENPLIRTKKIMNGDIKIVCVGQLCIRKGQHRLLSVIKNYSDYKLTFIGRENPEYLADIKLINSNFEHIKHLEHKELQVKLSEYDLFVLPSIEDGFAVVVMEALMAGLPVLVSKYAGASEVISQIGGGLVYDPLDENDFHAKYKLIKEGSFPELHANPMSWEEYAAQLSSVVINLLKR